MGQRKFLVNGVIRGAAFGPSPVPVTTIATLEPGEAFDESTVLALQHMLLEQNPGAEMARVLGFQQLETAAPVNEVRLSTAVFGLLNDAEREHIAQMFRTQGLDNGLADLHRSDFSGKRLTEPTSERVEHPIEGWTCDELKLNSGCMLAPVNCPLLIEVAPDVLVPASRPTFAESKGDQLVFETETGLTIIGRPRWTYP